MKVAIPFNRKELLSVIDSFIKLRYGSFESLLNLSVRDISEINIALESKAKEQQVEELLSGL